MYEERAAPPTIVVGMHRSGTTMLMGMLSDLGLHTGWWHENQLRGHLHEASLFLDLNRRILRAAGGSWQHPEAIDALLERPDARRRIVEEVREGLRGLSPAVTGYLGPIGFLRYRTPARLDRPWGWKDPRSTLTLPLWLEVFPDAKVLHVYRHGVDVASSMVARDRAILEDESTRLGRLKSRILPWRKRDDFMIDARLLREGPSADLLDRGVAIWAAYTERARRHASALGKRALELRYEEFLARPRPALERICEFCTLDPDEPALARTASSVRADRAFAYRRDPEGVACAERTAPLLASLGYEP